MITERKLKSLKPGTNLYRVLSSTRGRQISYTCHKAAINKITVQYVTFVENTRATSHGKRQRIEWVCENMSISREGAWDHAVARMEAEILVQQGRIRVINADIKRLTGELVVVKNRGKR